MQAHPSLLQLLHVVYHQQQQQLSLQLSIIAMHEDNTALWCPQLANRIYVFDIGAQFVLQADMYGRSLFCWLLQFVEGLAN